MALQRDAALAGVNEIDMIDRSRNTQAAFHPRLLNWLYGTLHTIATSCVNARSKIIYTLGIREGDKHYWDFRFKGRMKRRTDADTDSARSWIRSQHADSSLSLVGGINIFSVSFSANSAAASSLNVSSLPSANVPSKLTVKSGQTSNAAKSSIFCIPKDNEKRYHIHGSPALKKDETSYAEYQTGPPSVLRRPIYSRSPIHVWSQLRITVCFHVHVKLYPV